jgi:hypothetical protein
MMHATRLARLLADKHGTSLAVRKVGGKHRYATACVVLAGMHPTRPIVEMAGAYMRQEYWRRVLKALRTMETVA